MIHDEDRDHRSSGLDFNGDVPSFNPPSAAEAPAFAWGDEFNKFFDSTLWTRAVATAPGSVKKARTSKKVPGP